MQTEIKLLATERFDEEANIEYKVPFDKLPKVEIFSDGEVGEVIDFEHEETLQVITEFIKHHKQKQVPRLKELRRYHESKNNIKYRESKRDEYRADNRIASDFVRFITTFKRGVLVGNAIDYSGDKAIMTLIDEFNQRSNIDYHNQLMVQDMILYGRAYELPYRNWQGKETITKLDVENTFVIYDTSSDKGSIVGVHYYNVKYLEEINTVIELYTNTGLVFRFETELNDWDNLKLIGEPEDTFSDAVMINEWRNNEERRGDSDAVLDDIDAYDLSQSELSNFMQDSSDAYLVIVGNPDTAKGKDDVTQAENLKQMREARMLVLGDKKYYGDGRTGAEPNAFYLKKEYDTTGAEAYKDRLVADILRFSFVVDFTDEVLGGNQTGVGMRFKGWGNDNDRATKENVVRKAIMRRLRLLANSWALHEMIRPENLMQSITNKVKGIFSRDSEKQKMYDLVNEVEIKFNPNIPQSDQELVENVKNLYGVVSDQTLMEMLERITGVNAEEEMERIKKENKEEEPPASRRPETEPTEEAVTAEDEGA